MGTVSSSSWGCELKLSSLILIIKRISHPLREDVSWNNSVHNVTSVSCVILFVRMWVEIACLVVHSLGQNRHPLREDVSWNTCTPPDASIVPVVILFVRMWVEMTWMDLSIWSEQRHPLREDVSWNTQDFTFSVFATSSSSWGCELKYSIRIGQYFEE